MAKQNEKRNYEIILYLIEDVNRYVNICIENGFDYAFIYHDKDLKEDKSDFKKPHYHFQIYMQNQKSLSRMSKIFNISENYIEYIYHKKKAIQYLTHADYNDKHNYSIFEIKSNMDLTKYFNNLVSDESVEMEIIFDFISRNKNISLLSVYKYVIDNNIWSTYRRNYSIIKDLIYEHNLLYKIHID